MITDANKILNFSLFELEQYLKNDAGVANSVFEGNVFGKDKLNLQQLPAEFAQFLQFLKKLESKSYLEIGVGHGGSFLLSTLFQTKLEMAHCVDNCAQNFGPEYENQQQSIKNKIEILKSIKKIDNIQFFNMSSEDFFINNKNNYDVIFIDGDHSYEGVKKDFDQALKIINDNGYIIFHDISGNEQGITKIWDELEPEKKVKRFQVSKICGIGVYKKY